MGHHIGGHTHGDPGGSIDEQVGEFGRKYSGLFQGVIEVEREIYGLFANIREHFIADPAQACLGVAHGCRAVAVNAAEVSLWLYEGIAQRPILGHAHHRVVYGRVAVRMVLAQYLAHDTGRFFERFVVSDPKF